MTAIMSSLDRTNGVTLVGFAARTANLTGSWIDLLDYEGQVMVLLAGTRSTGDLASALEHSDDGVTGAGAVDANAFSGLAAVTAGTTFLLQASLNISATKRFVRYVGTATNTPSHNYGLLIVGQKKYQT